MKTLLNLIAALAGIYVLVIVAAYALQDRLLFFPSPLSSRNRDALKDFEVCFDHGGTALHGWLYRREDAEGLPFLIYYGGNGEEVSWLFDPFAELPVSGFLLVNYRGYGDSGGKPTAAALQADAAFILEELVARAGVDMSQVVLMGRSLGTGVAVDLAADHPVAGLILVTPFDRLSSIGSHHYPWLPVRWLLRHEMNSVELAPRITAPSLVVLAERDGTVPPQYGRRLHEALGEPKELAVIVGADHNSVSGYEEYWRTIVGFLQGALPTD